MSSNETPWTKGPWQVVDNRDMCGEWWIVAEHPEVGPVSHASVRSGCGEADELGDMASNATLIAAAPEMAESLNAAPNVSKYHGHRGFELERFLTDYEKWNKRRRFVLSKANGEQP